MFKVSKKERLASYEQPREETGIDESEAEKMCFASPDIIVPYNMAWHMIRNNDVVKKDIFFMYNSFAYGLHCIELGYMYEFIRIRVRCRHHRHKM